MFRNRRALLQSEIQSYGQDVHYNYDRGTNFASYTSDYEQKSCKQYSCEFHYYFLSLLPVLLLRCLWYWTWLYTPDFCCIFSDGAVAGELPRARHIQDGLARPLIGIGI